MAHDSNCALRVLALRKLLTASGSVNNLAHHVLTIVNLFGFVRSIVLPDGRQNDSCSSWALLAFARTCVHTVFDLLANATYGRDTQSQRFSKSSHNVRGAVWARHGASCYGSVGNKMAPSQTING